MPYISKKYVADIWTVKNALKFMGNDKILVVFQNNLEKYSKALCNCSRKTLYNQI